MPDKKLSDSEIVKAWDILAKFDFFGGQRAGRELWNEKPVDVQNEDIKNFSKDVEFLKDLINRQKAEIERLEKIRQEQGKRIADLRGVKYEQIEVIHNLKQELITAKAEAYKEFAEILKLGIVNKPSEFKASQATVDFLNGLAHRQHEILDEINITYKELVGEEK